MDFIINYWFIILGIIALVAFVVFACVKFWNLPTSQQIANVKEWLRWAVVEAERELGTGTGQLKLRFVYDLAVAQFEWISRLVSFDTFSEWVDEALEWMEKQLFTNPNLKKLVEGESYGK